MAEPTHPWDLAGPLRTSVLACTEFTDLLQAAGGVWKGEPTVFTRRPVPADAPYPMLLIAPTTATGNRDTLVSRHQVVLRDLLLYGQQPDHYRLVETGALLLRTWFHRQHQRIAVPQGRVWEVVANGPFVAPVDSDTEVGRGVTLTISLQELPT